MTYSGYGAGLAHIVRTTDSDSSWQDVAGDFVSRPVNAIMLDPLEPNHWYIGADLGVWTSTDDGATWRLGIDTPHDHRRSAGRSRGSRASAGRPPAESGS